LSEKLAFALMNKHENLFEKFVESFYITYGKLQIEGHHTKVVEKGYPNTALAGSRN